MIPIPVAPKLFTTEPLRLVGGRHRETGKLLFPLPGDPAYDPIELPDRGSLWSFTIQRFAPKSPPYHGGAPFTPFAVGYVELPAAIIVETLLTGVHFETLRIGIPMELTTIEWRDTATGASRQCYAFRPSALAA